MQLPDYFEESYAAFEAYPNKLIARTSYFGALSAQSKRFNYAAPSLFVSNEDKTDVVFRDFDEPGQLPARENVRGDAMLRTWLGDTSTYDPLTATRVGKLASRKDPRCRFVFLWADSTRAPLKITKQMLQRIFTYHQVMPAYLDFVSVFGSHSGPKELRFSGFREQVHFEPSSQPVDDLRRSGRQFQLSFNLKSVTCKTPPTTHVESSIWSIRPVAIHHQFDIIQGTTLWIITKGNLELQKRVKDMTGAQGRPLDKTFDTTENCFRSTLGVHLMVSHFSAEEWRPYIQWLEDVVDLHTTSALDDARSQLSGRHEFRPEDLQLIQGYEDRTNEAVMIMESNVEVFTSLGQFYESLLKNPEFDLRHSCRSDIQRFVSQLDDIKYETKMQVKRANLLARIIGDRKILVLQHLQSQATDKMERLTVSMHRIGSMSQREAIIMRIITVAALIYLPATFVSSFFSTDVVKYQGQPDGGSYSSTAMNRWLQVTLPLTLVTVLGAIAWFLWADSQRKKGEVLLSDLMATSKG